jgi:hypothetical protein
MQESTMPSLLTPLRHAFLPPILTASFALVCTPALPLCAQELVVRTAPQVSVAADAGMAVATRWFSSPLGEGTLRPGPTVGAAVEGWASPMLGVRLHASYASQQLRGVTPAARVHAYLYDAAVVARPFFWSRPRVLADAYLFAGGGGATFTAAGDTAAGGGGDCRAAPATAGVCVPIRAVTRPQLTAGGGTGLLEVSPGVRLFSEVEIHLFRPPVRARSVTDSSFAPDLALLAAPPREGSPAGLAALGRLVLGARFDFGEFIPAPPPPPPPPPLLPAEVPFVLKTDLVGAEVYLVPADDAALHWATLCRQLRPLPMDPRFVSRTQNDGTTILKYREWRPSWLLVVRLNGREYAEVLQLLPGPNTVPRTLRAAMTKPVCSPIAAHVAPPKAHEAL